MQIQINTPHFELTPAIEDHVREQVNHAVRHHADQVTRIEGHLRDDNAGKGGVDKRCVLEVRLAGHQPLAVETVGEEIYGAIAEASGKLERAVANTVERRDGKR